MNLEEQERAARLGRAWDSLVSGTGGHDGNPAAFADIQFVQELTAVPAAPTGLRATIWQQVNGRSLASTMSTVVVAPSPNGVAHPPARPVEARVGPTTTAGAWRTALRIIAIGAMAGFGAGFLAGLWTRAAMRLSGFLTVDRNRGLLTENDAVVGQVTLDGTLFLAFFAAALGILGGVLYVAIRRWLPGRSLLRAGTYGLLLFAVFGFVVMDEHNPDYRLFGPTWLNVGTFSLTYLVYGSAVSLIAEWLERRLPRLSFARAAGAGTIVASLALSFFGAVGIMAIASVFLASRGSMAAAILAAMLALYVVSRFARIPALSPQAWSPLVRRAGGLAMLVPGFFGVYLTIQGIAGIFAG